MNDRTIKKIVFLSGVIVLLTANPSVFAQDMAAEDATTETMDQDTLSAPREEALDGMMEVAADTRDADAGPAPEITPEEMMAKIKEYGTTNDHHRVLDYFIGNWDYEIKWWLSPDAEPEESTGTNVVTSIMGGRFIEQNSAGVAMGQPFEGKGITGFDNVKQQYTSIWIDNMGTGIMTSSGSYDPETKILSEVGTMSCPLEGQKFFRGETTIIDENIYVYVMHANAPDGREFQSMLITYKRRP